MIAQPGVCQTWSETPKTGFLTTRLICLVVVFVAVETGVLFYLGRFLFNYYLMHFTIEQLPIEMQKDKNPDSNLRPENVNCLRKKSNA